MKVCRDLTSFYHKNNNDINKFISKKFSNVIKYYDIEDLKADIYLRLHRKSYIQNYRPFEIQIDPETRTWKIQPTAAKFSTYICKFILNYIYAYHNKINPNHLCLSLDDFNDSNYSEEDHISLKTKEIYNPMDRTDLTLEIEKILEYLKEKTEFKGNIVSDDKISENILKVIDKSREKGCDLKMLIEAVGYKDLPGKCITPLEESLITLAIKSIEKKGYITEEHVNNDKKYFLNKIERRSLYNLFNYYIKGYRDKEISKKFKMTVAGIGALKRTLRKEITNCLENQ